VTIARDTTLDLRLRAIQAPPPSPAPPAPPSACSYTVSPSQSGTDYQGGRLTATISRTTGSCSWQAGSDAGWITFPGGASGSGNGTLAYVIAGNPTFNTRVGRITISWSGGTAQVQVTQGHHPDYECSVSLNGPQDLANVPSAGAQLTVQVSVNATPSGWNGSCRAHVAASVPWISGGGEVVGGMPAAISFSVAPNPSPAAARSGAIVASGAGTTQTLAVTQR
jgi:Putative binding domain, N-terminal